MLINGAGGNGNELKDLHRCVDRHVGKWQDLWNEQDGDGFDLSLMIYLIVHDLTAGLNGVGRGFMSLLESGRIRHRSPRPVADVVEPFCNNVFDHTGSRLPALSFGERNAEKRYIGKN